MKYEEAPIYVKALVNKVIDTEGGYVNHNNDKGGETKYGITVITARRNGYYSNMEFLPLEIARDIYVNEYFYKPRVDLIAKHSAKVAEEVFDSGVNCGSIVAVKWLQESLNVLNRQETDYKDIVEDGILGRNTEVALLQFLVERGKSGEQVLHTALNCLQGAYYIKLSKIRAKNESFTYGWLKQRVVF